MFELLLFSVLECVERGGDCAVLNFRLLCLE